MRYRQPTLWAALLVIATSMIVACATLQQGEDPLVVRTQQTLTMGQGIYDWSMGWCRANAAKLSPAGLVLVNKIRVDFPVAYRALDQALDAYKAGKAGDFQKALDAFNSLVGQLCGTVIASGGPDPAAEVGKSGGGS